MIFVPEYREAGAPQNEAETAIREGQAVDQRWHQRKAGTKLYVDGVLVGLRDAGRELVGFAKIVQDRTELMLAQQELETRSGELVSSNDALQEVEQALIEQNEELLESRLVLERERESLRMLFELAPAAFLVTGNHGRVEFANRAAHDLLGTANLRGKLLLASVHPENRRDFRSALSR